MMRKYRNTEAAQALVFYAMTENIDYRYPMYNYEYAFDRPSDYHEMLNLYEGLIRRAKVKLRVLYEKKEKKSWDEEKFEERFYELKSNFLSSIPILRAMHPDHSSKYYDEYIRPFVNPFLDPHYCTEK